MANNYCLTSTLFQLDTAEEVDKAVEVLEQIRPTIVEEFSGFPEWEPLNDEEQCGIWFHDEEAADIEAIKTCLVELMKALPRKEPVIMSWAETCSAPRIGEFTGGALAVLEDGTVLWCHALDTVDRAVQNVREIQAKSKKE